MDAGPGSSPRFDWRRVPPVALVLWLVFVVVAAGDLLSLNEPTDRWPWPISRLVNPTAPASARAPWDWDERPTINWYEGASSDLAQAMGSASASVQRGDQVRARHAVERLRRDYPDVPGLAMMTGWAQAEAGDLETGLRTMRDQIARTPTASAWKILATTLAAHQRQGDAIRAWMEGRAAFPDDREFALYLGQALVDQRRFDEAVPVLEAVIAVEPQSARLHYALGLAHASAGHLDTAQAAFSRVLELEARPRVLQRLAWELAEATMALDAARAFAEKAVVKAEADVTRTARALDHAAIDDSRTLAYYWGALGVVLFARGELPNAEPYLEVAWRLTGHGQFATYLGQLHERSGRRDAAKDYWEAAVAANSGDGSAVIRLQELGDGRPVDEIRSTGYRRLIQTRTIALTDTPAVSGEGRVSLLIDRAGRIEAAKWLGGVEALQPATERLPSVDTGVRLPAAATTPLAHKGTIICGGERNLCLLLLTPQIR